ncbi:3'-phosphoesterase [Candidatus Woesearchaeota archaeon]|nr:3'-phosphoesterase [Candidatus Woesearchaeota archaeon]MBW3017690.1 3'-phosphoesterase [Candidatus Woesearchaeota archaeon]
MPRFVVHEHKARRLHYDLRLAMEGVAKSWAVPKTPPLKAGLKRLAVQVEDHSISYMKFEGEIPEGQYGAGTVKIWDKGSYKLLDKKPGKIVAEFKGNKLKGEYCLVKFARSGPKNWLFFKVKKK